MVFFSCKIFFHEKYRSTLGMWFLFIQKIEITCFSLLKKWYTIIEYVFLFKFYNVISVDLLIDKVWNNLIFVIVLIYFILRPKLIKYNC